MANSTPQNRTKRKKDENSPEFDSDEERSSNEDDAGTQEQTNLWSRFLVMESADETRQLSSLTPFIVEKAMKGIAGTVKNCKQLRSGSILIETARPAQSQNLLKQNMFANIPVKVTVHRTLNTCKGVIRNFQLARMDPDNLVLELASQGVTAVRVVKQKRGDVIRLTPVIIVTFATPTPPPEIRAGYLNVKVEEFIPNPLRCFKCQRFGHHESTCTRPTVCAKCSAPAHGEEPCSGNIKCPNCNGDHPAYATSCPKWAQEKEICRVKTINKISFPEARRMVLPSAQDTRSRLNYAAAIKGKTSVATQTDASNCDCAGCAPIKLLTKVTAHSQTTETQTEQQNSDQQQTNMETNQTKQLNIPTNTWHKVSPKHGRREANTSLSPKTNRGDVITGQKTGRAGPSNPVKPDGRRSNSAQREKAPPNKFQALSSLADDSADMITTGRQARCDAPRKQILPP